MDPALAVWTAKRDRIASLLRAKGYAAEFIAPSFSQFMGGENLTHPFAQVWIVYACAKAKASAVGSVELCLFESDADDAKELPDSHPLVRMFKRPNKRTTWAMLLEAGVYSRIQWGEDWWLLLKADGRPIDRQGDVPEQIVQVRPQTLNFDTFDRYGFPTKYSVSFANGERMQFEPFQILPFIDYDPSDCYRGLGALESVARIMQVDYKVERYVESIATEGGDPGGFVILPPEAGAEEVKRAQAEIDDEFGQPSNRGKWKVISGADFRANPISPKDMEFTAFLDHFLRAVSAVTGVPLPVVGILEDATYSNLENALRAMWTGPNGVLPYLRSIEDRINAFFFSQLSDASLSGVRARFDTKDIAELQRDMTPRVESAARVAVMGVGATFNEALALCGVDQSVPGGDVNMLNDIDDPFAEEDPESDGGDAPTQPDGSVAGDGVQDQLLNGAQMQAAVDIVALVAAGDLPRDSGVQLLVTLLGLTVEQAEAIMGTAGTGTTTTPNKPDAPPDAPGGEPEGEQVPDDDADKRARPTTKTARRGPLGSREARQAYADRIVEKVMVPGEVALRKLARAYIRAYQRAQLARFREFAAKGTLARQFRDIDEALLVRITGDDISLLDLLLLNKETWEKKMRDRFEPALRRIAESALDDLASEFGSVSIGVNDPRVLDQLSRQVIQLSEGVTSTLADKVRRAMVETFKDDTTIGFLQQAIKDKLPELEGNLALAFRDKEHRAQTIARTEAAHATNGARQVQMRAEGVTQVEWATAGDDAVRKSHEDLDGQVRSIGEDFLPGLAFPTDPRAPASESINCRCVTSPLD